VPRLFYKGFYLGTMSVSLALGSFCAAITTANHPDLICNPNSSLISSMELRVSDGKHCAFSYAQNSRCLFTFLNRNLKCHHNLYMWHLAYIVHRECSIPSTTAVPIALSLSVLDCIASLHGCRGECHEAKPYPIFFFSCYLYSAISSDNSIILLLLWISSPFCQPSLPAVLAYQPALDKVVSCLEPGLSIILRKHDRVCLIFRPQ
jgi:hypothetical protein